MDADLFELYKPIILDNMMKEIESYTSTVMPYSMIMPFRNKPTHEDVRRIMLDIRSKRSKPSNQTFCEIKYTSQILLET